MYNDIIFINKQLLEEKDSNWNTDDSLSCLSGWYNCEHHFKSRDIQNNS